MKPRVIIVLLLIILGLGYIFYANKQYRWIPTYENTINEPYDLGLLTKLLKHEAKKSDVIETGNFFLLPQNESGQYSYFFVGGYFTMQTDTFEKLLEDVYEGTDIFICAEEVESGLDTILFRYFPDVSITSQPDSEIEIELLNSAFADSSLSFTYMQKDKEQEIQWNSFIVYNETDYPYYESEVDTDIKFEVLSSNGILANCIKAKVGRGSITYMKTPLLLTNFFLKEEQGFHYVSHIFKDFNKEKVYLDFSSLSYTNPDIINEQSANVLSFILSDKVLRIVWYLFLIGIILFLVLYLKRVQRAIPVLPVKKNTSLQFNETMGRLFFSKTSNREMAIIKMNLFLSFLKRRGNKGIPEDAREAAVFLHKKTGVSEELIFEIFYFGNNVKSESKEPYTQDFLAFSENINLFYQTYNYNK